ncbi:hypothetical protein L7F22_051515 [Adiantum nelumboides]|nr:hypothetical protein [Adiantum nelumboides]
MDAALPSSRRLAFDSPTRSSADSQLAATSSLSSRIQNADVATPSSSGISYSADVGTPTVSSRNYGADLSNPSFSDRGRKTDPEFYSAGQSLASILNNPHLGKGGAYGSDASWGGWLFSSSASDIPDNIVPAPGKPVPDITKADFQPYLNAISDAYGRFADVREHSNWEKIANQDSGASTNDSISGDALVQGEGLVACLREIPSLYFKEDFALEDGSTFQVACPYSSIPQNMMLQEKLSHYLDIIEVHLVREIEARSESFYEAQGQLEGLNSEIVLACSQIKELKAVVELSEIHVVKSAQHVQKLNQQREMLLTLHRKLNYMSYVNQALGDLPLLVAAADCGGALDVIDVLQNLLKQGKKHDRKRKKSTDFLGYLGSQSTFDKAKKHKKHAAVPSSSSSSSESSSESSEEERRSKKRSRRHRHGKGKRKTRKSRSRRVDDSSTEDSSTDSSDSEDGHFYANKKNFYKANQYDFLEDKSKKVREFKEGGQSIL